MKEGFRQSMAWLHTWTGLLVGWLLFFTFLTGTLGYVNHEIDRWMRPEAPMVSTPPSAAELLPKALARLSLQTDQAKSWSIRFPGGRSNNDFQVSWRAQPKEGERFGKFTRETLDPVTGANVNENVRKTGGGHLLYRMHYRLHYMPARTAYWILGICSMFMFVAIISGIIIHKKIFKDFFTFRPKKGQRSWLDGHAVLCVTSLPFHLMITYSGLVFLMFTYMPLGIDVIYGEENEDQFFEEAFDEAGPGPKEIMPSAATSPLMPMLVEVEKYWGAENVSGININNPGRANATVTFRPRNYNKLVTYTDTLTFNGVTGKFVEGKDVNFASQTNNVMLSLHEGLFAGPLLRALYLVAGVAGTAMIGTGLLLWSKKRKAKLSKGGIAHFGIAVVDRLNLGTIVGLPIAIAAYFWANRLIPVDFDARQDWEVHAMFITWGVMFVYPVWRPLDRAWFEMLCLMTAAYALLPVVNLLTTDRHLGITVMHGDWVLAGFDLSCLAASGIFALVTIKAYSKVTSNAEPSILITPSPLREVENYIEKSNEEPADGSVASSTIITN